MSFSPPPGSQLPNKNLKSSQNPTKNTDRDSFDLQFEDSLDAAFESLQVPEGSRQKDNNTAFEDFEMKSMHSDHQTSMLNSDVDTAPLINNSSNPGRLSLHNDRNAQYTNNSIWLKAKSWFESSFSGSKSKHSSLSAYNTSSSTTNTTKIELNDQNVEREIHPATTPIYDRKKYPSNVVSNAKYNPFTFIPIILYEQFKFFFNLYFLLVALSQAIPQLRIGYLSSYIVPLAFVLTVTMSKEAMDDINRRKRDRESNNELYEVVNKPGPVPSKDLKVGDIIKLKKGSRVPADVVVLQTNEPNGESFIKTDQLDGETDWKLRLACPLTQTLTENDIFNNITITASAPEHSIHKFNGKITYKDSTSAPLTVDNTMWENTVLASSAACVCCVVYTGRDTRQSMNTTKSSVKTGLLELEINGLSKILCACVFLLSIILVAFAGFDNKDWYVDIMRYLILFSTIIPVSLRVNLDLGKSVYAYKIEHDKQIKDTIVRTSTIPEDLGRIEYLLSDKTGTLTQNDMQLKKIHLGSVSYTNETMDIVSNFIQSMNSKTTVNTPATTRKSISERVIDLVTTLAICHNVTPTFEDGELTYQAASPDEIAIVKFTESVGLSLFKRDRNSISLFHDHSGMKLEYDIKMIFPFNSDSKRMGVIIVDKQKQEYWFLQKGADTVMSTIVVRNDWLDEETSNMAREGLRTLVIGRKKLTSNVFEQFEKEYSEASLTMMNREVHMQNVVKKYLENDLELLGLTGVEDKLQKDVKSSIELLRNAGIKIWMLTGDKVETARCVSISAKLIARGQYVHTVTKVNKPEGALRHLEYLQVNHNSCLLIDGESLGLYLQYYPDEFFEIVVNLPTVVACRCTPQQKADVALFIRHATGKRVCCIGDGGNDVSMIQSADVGVGIVGKEGKQASLAADFSITQFCHLTKLLLWHGRNSYKSSAKLSQFVIHRGLIISVCQAVYSICSMFEPLALYKGWLMVGYATCYTMAPVFSMTLDHDIDESLTTLYPELYKELTLGKSLSFKTFFVWVALSVFQGCVIQLASQSFTSLDESDFTKMVAISFTALVMNELIMVALEINTWNRIMVITEVVTFIVYFGSIPFLGEYFDLSYVTTTKFPAMVLVILLISVVPVWATKSIYRRLNPPNYAKVQQFSMV